jgi:RNA polymerase sigma-70 factor (ECF subfamily)
MAADAAPDDAVLVRASQRGDREAFGVLVSRYASSILSVTTRMLGRDADAEDVAQETFVRLWRSARRWRPGEARLGTWLHRVALNLCLDRIGRRRETSLDGLPDPVDPAPPVVVLLERRAMGQRVDRELASLPAQQRIAITLCHYQGLRNLEAAEVMGVTVEALESLLARGRRTLRARLRGEDA